MILQKKKRYLQIALNSTLEHAETIINSLPVSDRILIEAGTPLIKKYGAKAIADIYTIWEDHLRDDEIFPYVVADLKTMDRAEAEVKIAKEAGASAAVVLGQAPIETINRFIQVSRELKIDSMVDMMGIEHPVKVIRRLSQFPDVIMLHRGVDEETYNKNKPIPYIQINKIRSSLDVLIAVAGGDTQREVQRAIFNDANIVVVWKDFYQSSSNIGKLAKDFLREIK